MDPRWMAMALAAMVVGCQNPMPRAMTDSAKPTSIRVASYNIALNDDAPGGVIARLEAGDDSVRQIAAVIQSVRPDVLLLNELDFDPAGRAAELLQTRYLAVGQFALAPIDYPYRYLAPVNTGEPSGLDLDGDGGVDGPNDAWGFGRHPGQYGMLLLSRFPLDAARVRSFRELRWAAMPDALRPRLPDGSAYHPESIWTALRLSSKSVWDVPIATPFGPLHVLASHPTPPAFDGPEDRNGARNHDEIRLLADYVSGGAAATWLIDDQGRRGGLENDARFVILGDMNADPVDGSSRDQAIRQLLDHPAVQDPQPRGAGGGAQAAARDGGANLTQRADPDHDTSDFGPRVGNLRVDYALPSRQLKVLGSGVFWPADGTPGADWVSASDHRLVWVDIGF